MTTTTTKTIVLDLDKTFVDSCEDIEIYKKHIYGKLNISKHILNLSIQQDIEDKEIYKLWSIKRPGTDDFLIYCFNNFDIVVIWSAGIKPYVKKCVDKLFFGKIQPHFVFDRDYCETSGEERKKPLSKLCKDINVDIKNVIMIDDDKDVTSLNPENVILIPEFVNTFEPVVNIQTKDNCLDIIKNFFETEEFKKCEDYRTLDKSKLFYIA